MILRRKRLILCASLVVTMVSFLVLGPLIAPALPQDIELPLATDTPAWSGERSYAYAPAVFQYDKLTATSTLTPTVTPEVSPKPPPTNTPAWSGERFYAYAPAVFQYDKLTATPTPTPTVTPEISPTPGPTGTPAES